MLPKFPNFTENKECCHEHGYLHVDLCKVSVIFEFWSIFISRLVILLNYNILCIQDNDETHDPDGKQLVCGAPRKKPFRIQSEIMCNLPCKIMTRNYDKDTGKILVPNDSVSICITIM